MILLLNLAVALISGQFCAVKLAKSEIMLGVLLLAVKNMKIKRMLVMVNCQKLC